jgi:hypothetical protein
MQEIASMAGVELPEFLGKLKETQKPKTKSAAKVEVPFPDVPESEPEQEF